MGGDGVTRVAGGILLGLPFLVMTTLMVREDGWRMAAIVWSLTAAVVACIALGVLLLQP